MILKETCPTCQKENKTSLLKTSVKLKENTILVFECGHNQVKAKKAKPSPALFLHTPEEPKTTVPNVSDYEVTVSPSTIKVLTETEEIARFEGEGNTPNTTEDLSWYSLFWDKKAYAFQKQGVEFVERTGYKALIADEPGLGKTIQALLALKRNKRLFPALILVKATLIYQWVKQYKTWTDGSPLGVMPVTGREVLIPGLNVYVMSRDLLGRKGVVDKVKKLGIKTIIVDESQGFKNPSTGRTKALITLIQECRIENRIFLSGTPIENRASEYFTILNLLDPVNFNSFKSFCQHWLVPNDKGIYTRIDSMLLDRFHRLTSRYIIRRKERDVKTDMPPLTVNPEWVEIVDERYKDIYNSELDLFGNFMESGGTIGTTQILGWLAKMRAITGQAKVSWCFDYVTNFIESTEKKIMVGVHHHAVRDVLYAQFKAEGIGVVKFEAGDNADAMIQEFSKPENRVLLISTLAGGEGVDGLQKICWDGILLERQWNNSKEVQLFKRLSRDGQNNHTDILIANALGTIDQWFHELVGYKALVCDETIDGKEIEDSLESLKEFAMKVIENRLR